MGLHPNLRLISTRGKCTGVMLLASSSEVSLLQIVVVDLRGKFSHLHHPPVLDSKNGTPFAAVEVVLEMLLS